MSDNETLKDAFARLGEAGATDSLTDSAKKMTKADIRTFLKLDDSTISSLRNFAQNRVKQGGRVVPWDDVSTSDDAGDDMKGGFW